MDEYGAQWAQIQAEYINTSISLKALAAKYGVSLATVKRESAREKWSEKRRAYAADKRERVTQKLHDKDVSQTVKDIDRCCRAAGKLIDKIMTAINQLDKTAFVSFDEQAETKSESRTDNSNVIRCIKTRKLHVSTAKGLIDTRRLIDLARALLCIKQVLTCDSGKAFISDESGIIEIPAVILIDPREDEQIDSGE